MYPDVTIVCAECGHEQVLDPADFDPVCDECGSTDFEHNREDES